MSISSHADNANNHKQENKAKVVNENPTEAVPLQQRLNEINVVTRRSTRMSSVAKTEKERTPIVLVRDIDRAASLPIEKRNYLFDYSVGERGRGYSVQRDKVISFLYSFPYIYYIYIYILDLFFVNFVRNALCTMQQLMKRISIIPVPGSAPGSGETPATTGERESLDELVSDEPRERDN